MNIKTITCLSALLAITSCGGSSSDLEIATGKESIELESNKLKWSQRNINSYQFKYNVSCFCLEDEAKIKQVIVLDGAVKEAFFLDSSTYLTPDQLSRVKTVNQLFTIVEQAIKQKAYQLSVSYHTSYGYPERISIDYKKDAVDDEVTYYLTDLM